MANRIKGITVEIGGNTTIGCPVRFYIFYSGTVIDNHISQTVNQTNNSQKSLSRLEIYRQTRNAVKV